MKNFLLLFGTGSPAVNTGLAPTFTVFKSVPGGVNLTAPGITEIPSSTGMYYFTYGPTAPISFVIDGATSGLASSVRYVAGLLDPIQTVDELIGLTLYPLAATAAVVGGLIGDTGSTYGGATTDPGTVFGYLKRLQEFNEGNSSFDKSTSIWDVYSRGSSTLLAEKTLNDATGSIVKT